jgi:serine/threonine-protein kinase
MSPEQASGQAVDARSDLYSVGVLLFEMLTGRCPFGGGVVTVLRQHMTADVPDLPAAVTASVDPRIVALLRRLLAKLPEDRFASTTELMDAIDECSNERDVSALPAPVRPSLESVRGMATPIAQRVRRSVLAGFKAIEDAGRFPLHDPKVLLRHATPERLMLGAVAVAAIATMIAVRAAGGRTHVATSATAPMSTTSAAVVVPIPRLSDPPLSTDAGAQPSGSSPLQSAPSRGHRRTGPGGIYIPPPNQWFKR